MNITNSRLSVTLDERTLSLAVKSSAGVWQTLDGSETYVEFFRENSTSVRQLLCEASHIEISSLKTGTGEGIRVSYSDFPCDPSFALDTVWWLEDQTGFLYAWAAPAAQSTHCLKKLAWPAPFSFEGTDPRDITVYPLMQGTLIPNGWDQDFDLDQHWELESDHVYTRSAYMPWWGQLRQEQGYMAILQTPWDAGFSLKHPAKGSTSVRVLWNASLGQLGYGRCIRFEFLTDADYTSLCKRYRTYLKERGQLTTLSEKFCRNPKAHRLLGTSIIHTGIWQEVKPSCRFSNQENPEPVFTPYFNTFSQRADQLEQLHQRGLENAYVHVDGWGNAGYDSQHPDVLPPAPQCGGWEGLAQLEETAHRCGFSFALHDQYRDYYLDAPSYQPELAIHDRTGAIPTSDLWVGGTQAFLCPSQSLNFIRRNYNALKEKGLLPDGVYLDVFSCVALDECWHPQHPVTRCQCMDLREECFEWMRANGVVVSSEEGIGWAMNSLDLMHHANYALVYQLKENMLIGESTGKAYGIPVPLLNLVYHDCIVTPWFVTPETSEAPAGQNPFLHALLNGGVPYVDLDADENQIQQSKIVSDLHRLVGDKEMLSHSFVGDLSRQKTCFAGGITVEVDFEENEYHITQEEEVLV